MDLFVLRAISVQKAARLACGTDGQNYLNHDFTVNNPSNLWMYYGRPGRSGLPLIFRVISR
jgi:hypothetical protein